MVIIDNFITHRMIFTILLADGAGIFFITKDNKSIGYVLAQQESQGSKKGRITILGGEKEKKDTDLFDTGRRELKEETNGQINISYKTFKNRAKRFGRINHPHFIYKSSREKSEFDLKKMRNPESYNHMWIRIKDIISNISIKQFQNKYKIKKLSNPKNSVGLQNYLYIHDQKILNYLQNIA